MALEEVLKVDSKDPLNPKRDHVIIECGNQHPIMTLVNDALEQSMPRNSVRLS